MILRMWVVVLLGSAIADSIVLVWSLCVQWRMASSKRDCFLRYTGFPVPEPAAVSLVA